MNLSNRVKDRIIGLDGNIGMYFYDIKKDMSCFVGNCDKFISMGIAKLLVAVEVIHQAQTGSIDLDAEFILPKVHHYGIPESKYEETVGILDFFHPGMRLTIEDLLRAMVVISDNYAFNALLELVTPQEVNKTARRLGMSDTTVGSFIYDGNISVDRPENCHSVREIGNLLELIYRRQLISHAASEKLLRLLSYHQRRDTMSYFQRHGMSVAQMTGFDTTFCHEAAIVLADTPFIFVMSVSGLYNRVADQVIRDVSILCLDSARNPLI